MPIFFLNQKVNWATYFFFIWICVAKNAPQWLLWARDKGDPDPLYVLQLNHINHHSHDFNTGTVKSTKQTAVRSNLGMYGHMPSVTYSCSKLCCNWLCHWRATPFRMSVHQNQNDPDKSHAVSTCPPCNLRNVRLLPLWKQHSIKACMKTSGTSTLGKKSVPSWFKWFCLDFALAQALWEVIYERNKARYNPSSWCCYNYCRLSTNTKHCRPFQNQPTRELISVRTTSHKCNKISLVGAAASMRVCCDKTHLLLRQKHACRNKSDEIMFITRKVLLRQNFCSDKNDTWGSSRQW